MLLLDEPFGALDAKVRKELRGWLRRLHDDLHITTLFVTHDQEEALEVADRIVVLNHGAVEQVGDPQDVYDHPASAFVCEFLGAANQLHGAAANGAFRVEGYTDSKCDASANVKSDASADASATETLVARADFEGPALAYVRPHDLQLYPRDAARRDGIDLQVQRVMTLGGSVKIELGAPSGRLFEAQLDRDAWRRLELAVGDAVTAVPRALRVFPA